MAMQAFTIIVGITTNLLFDLVVTFLAEDMPLVVTLVAVDDFAGSGSALIAHPCWTSSVEPYSVL